MTESCAIYDVTLRDGAQCANISFSARDRVNIIAALDMLGVGYIECGHPGASPKEDEFFERLGEIKCENATLAAFGATRRKGIAAGNDPHVVALARCKAPVATFFGKASVSHVKSVLGVSLAENLDMIRETAEYLRANGKRVFFDAEHFFDGYASDKEYAMSALRAALDGGCEALTLCDTNGGRFPDEIAAVVAEVRAALPDAALAIHCHNDMGLATACSISSVCAGAGMVQGTLIGIGERCGNASLCEIIPSLQLKKGYACLPGERLRLLATACRFVASTANITLPAETPYIGGDAFAHKAGMHVDAMQKLEHAFEHIDPEVVGNTRRFLASELAGRAALLPVARRIDPSITRDSPELETLLGVVKDRERAGWQFEAAEASLELLFRKKLGKFTPHFDLIYYRTLSQHSDGGLESVSATVKLSVGGQAELVCAEGDGPVHALDLALRKTLSLFYPGVAKFWLQDFKVRVITPSDATAAVVLVWMNSTDGKQSWNTVGVSRDIIEASWLALADAVEYQLI